jgi:hypothetical protein
MRWQNAKPRHHPVPSFGKSWIGSFTVIAVPNKYARSQASRLDPCRAPLESVFVMQAFQDGLGFDAVTLGEMRYDEEAIWGHSLSGTGIPGPSRRHTNLRATPSELGTLRTGADAQYHLDAGSLKSLHSQDHCITSKPILFTL